MKHYVRLPDGETGIVETALSVNDLYRLYPADTIIRDTPFPPKAGEIVKSPEPVVEKKPRAKTK